MKARTTAKTVLSTSIRPSTKHENVLMVSEEYLNLFAYIPEVDLSTALTPALQTRHVRQDLVNIQQNLVTYGRTLSRRAELCHLG